MRSRPATSLANTSTSKSTEPHRLHLLRLEQHAPRGIGVKDLRPLRGRALTGPILDPDALLDAAQKQAENEQEKINDKNRGLTGPAPALKIPRHLVKPRLSRGV